MLLDEHNNNKGNYMIVSTSIFAFLLLMAAPGLIMLHLDIKKIKAN